AVSRGQRPAVPVRGGGWDQEHLPGADDALEGQGVVEGPGGRRVLQRPAVDAEVVLGSVDQLDEVVLENSTGVAPAAIDLLDLEVTGLDDGGLRHRYQAGQGRQPQGEGRCGDAEAGGALPDGGTDRACAHGGTLLGGGGAGGGRWGEGAGGVGGRGGRAGGGGGGRAGRGRGEARPGRAGRGRTRGWRGRRGGGRGAGGRRVGPGRQGPGGGGRGRGRSREAGGSGPGGRGPEAGGSGLGGRGREAGGSGLGGRGPEAGAVAAGEKCTQQSRIDTQRRCALTESTFPTCPG